MAFLLGALGLGSLLGESKTTIKNTTDVLNEAITNISTSVINNNSVAVASSQTINLSCDPEVAIAAMTICKDSINENCNVCTASDLSQEIILAINLTKVDDNTIASQIKDEINSKLEKEVQNVKGAAFLTKTKTDIENLTTIKNKLMRNYNNNIVNNTIKNFVFDQKIEGKNIKTNKISQKLVANVIANEITKNALSNDSDFKQTIESADKVKNTETGLFQDIGSSISGIIGTTFSGVSNLASTIFKGTFGMFILFIIIFIILLKTGILCMVPFPPLVAMLTANGYCFSGSKNDDSEKKHNKYDDDDDEQIKYTKKQSSYQQDSQYEESAPPYEQEITQTHYQQTASHGEEEIEQPYYQQTAPQYPQQVQPQYPQQVQPQYPQQEQQSQYQQQVQQPQYRQSLPNINPQIMQNVQNKAYNMGTQMLNRAPLPPIARQGMQFANKYIIPASRRDYV